MSSQRTYKKLGEIAYISAGQGAPQGEENYSEIGIPFIKAGNLEWLVSGGKEDDVQKVSNQVATSHRLKLYKAGSVVFAKSGMSCLKGHVYCLKKDCYVVSHLAILTPFGVDSSYLMYCLQYHKPSTLIKDGAYPSISLADIEKMPIPLPSLSEQQSIVKELDAINVVIAAKNTQLLELNALAQALFYDTFGDPLENPKGWNVLKLSDVVDEQCKMSYGIVQPGDDVEGGVPVVRPVDFKDSVYIKKDGLKKTLPSISDSYRRTILRGDEILICVRGTTGTMGLATPDLKGCNVTRGIVPLYFKNGMNKWFMYEYLKSDFVQNIIAENTYGATLKQINISALRNIPVIVPPLDLQQAFAKKIEAIEAQKQTLRQSIAEFESLLAQRMNVHFG